MPARRAFPLTQPDDRLAARRLALRAIMDGRGVEAVVLSSAPALAHYGGPEPGGLLLVTAREARPVHGETDVSPWAMAAKLLPAGCALGHEEGGHEEGMSEGEGLAGLARRVRPRLIVDLSADLARQIADG